MGTSFFSQYASAFAGVSLCIKVTAKKYKLIGRKKRKYTKNIEYNNKRNSEPMIPVSGIWADRARRAISLPAVCKGVH
jgi:hypothetical protein